MHRPYLYALLSNKIKMKIDITAGINKNFTIIPLFCSLRKNSLAFINYHSRFSIRLPFGVGICRRNVSGVRIDDLYFGPFTFYTLRSVVAVVVFPEVNNILKRNIRLLSTLARRVTIPFLTILSLSSYCLQAPTRSTLAKSTKKPKEVNAIVNFSYKRGMTNHFLILTIWVEHKWSWLGCKQCKVTISVEN